MYLIYSIILSFGFLLMLPLFLLRREKYASGFSERLGNYPLFKHEGRPVIWLHCVSVGETNAARPLVDAIRKDFPNQRLIVSTTTRTGHELAKNIFTDKADAIVYFPFDWKFSVCRALRNYEPSLVLLMETEIWPRFIHEAKLSGAKVAIVNGRVSQRSFDRYSMIRSFVARVLEDVDLALMQNDADAERIERLGIPSERVMVVGNLKFEQPADASESKLTEAFRSRFGISTDKPLIIAASTHEPEERYVIESLEGELSSSCRLMIAPRHPERFDTVEKLLRDSPYKFVRRSDPESDDDADADVILLDSIGELRAAYPLAEIVFVGGSLIPHGGQSIIEPAAEGKAIVTGPYTSNFDAVVTEFREHDAVRQTLVTHQDFEITEQLYDAFMEFLENPDRRTEVGRNAVSLMRRSDKGATKATIAQIQDLLSGTTDIT